MSLMVQGCLTAVHGGEPITHSVTHTNLDGISGKSVLPACNTACVSRRGFQVESEGTEAALHWRQQADKGSGPSLSRMAPLDQVPSCPSAARNPSDMARPARLHTLGSGWWQLQNRAPPLGKASQATSPPESSTQGLPWRRLARHEETWKNVPDSTSSSVFPCCKFAQHFKKQFGRRFGCSALGRLRTSLVVKNH